MVLLDFVWDHPGGATPER